MQFPTSTSSDQMSSTCCTKFKMIQEKQPNRTKIASEKIVRVKSFKGARAPNLSSMAQSILQLLLLLACLTSGLLASHKCHPNSMGASCKPREWAPNSNQGNLQANLTPSSSSRAFYKRDLAASLAPQPQDDSPNGGGGGQSASQNVCQVEGGESVAIVEIEESRGSDASQATSPSELPISGSVELGEIELKIESETHKYFKINNKQLQLIRPLDRDAILKEISCIDKRPKQATNNGGGGGKQVKKVIIPVLVKVLDLNDQAPRFTQSHYYVQVNELAPVGTVILDQIAYALDLDSANNGQVEYSLLGQQQQQPQSSQMLGSSSSATTEQVTTTVGRFHFGSSGSSQRLIQRTLPTITTTPSSVTTSSTTPSQTSSVSISTTVASRDGDSSGEPALSVSGSTEAPPVEIGSTRVSAETSSQLPPSRSATPTINMNSEPILNGPMDETDEEESDEAMLAVLNASGGTNSSDLGDQEQPEQPDMLSTLGLGLHDDPNSDGGDSSPIEGGTLDKQMEARLASGNRRHSGSTAPSEASQKRRRRRRRKRRHLTTTSANLASDLSRQKKLPLTTTTVTTLASTTGEISATTQNPPWTNLMMIMPNANDADLMQAYEQQAGGNRQFASLENGIDLKAQAGEQFEDEPEASEFFSLELAPQTGRPVIKLKRALDYETKRVHKLTLIATDRASNKQERLSSRARIIVRVLDGDDQPPAFVLDQVGCATNTLPHFTTPLPQQNHQEIAASQATTSTTTTTAQESALDLLQVDSKQSSSNKRLKPPPKFATSFKVTDEHFDFGDTLALDDTPLDDQQSSDPAGGRNKRVLGQHTPPVVAAGDQMATNQQQQLASRAPHLSSSAIGSSKLRSYDTMTDYLCLSSNSNNNNKLPNANGSSEQAIEYFASVVSGDSDYLLRVAPQAIKARDRDQLNAPIRYSFVNGTPSNFSAYFHINPLDATIKQIAPVEGVQVGEFVLFVKAEEQSYKKLFSLAKLIIDVLPSDKSPPVLMPTSYVGFVEENSPIGTRVSIKSDSIKSQLDVELAQVGVNSTSSIPISIPTSQSNNGPFLQIKVLETNGDTSATNAKGDNQFSSTTTSSIKQHNYEFETTSDAFKVDRDGFIFVNRFPLDRDAPHQAVHMFQVTARQVGLVSSRSVSSPISLNITLLDLNDNPPQLMNSSLTPLQMAANSRGGANFLTQIRAFDRDSLEHARQHFSILHVSNNGASRFRIDEETGKIECLGKFQAGEQFSLTLQVSDDLLRVSQGILDVQVVPGANSGGPQFLVESSGAGGGSSELARDNSRGYSQEINEAVQVNSVVLVVRAQDPENDPITYSLIDGNTNGDFSMNSRTGALMVANKLDREEISAYKLIVQARDSGGLATSRPIHITISDSNDQNPVFTQAQYVFAVEEGQNNANEFATGSSGRLLGRVTAQDNDEGENGRLSYSLISLRAAYSQFEPEIEISSGDENSTSDQRRVQAMRNSSNSNNRSAQQLDQPPSKPLFAIDERTGDIRLLEALDYERARSHTLLVMARDNGENPRSSSASVSIRVLDRQDELPYFERFHLESRLEENAVNQRVALVQARDPDSVAQITYVLLAGDASLFQVDPQTGLVTTTAPGLDFEQARFHTLLIGTNESLASGSLDLSSVAQHLSEVIAQQQQQQQAPTQENSPETINAQNTRSSRWPIVRVDVHVLDLNDEAPQFEAPHPLPVRVQDSATPGTVLETRLAAHDRDGSAPNNQIRYELVLNVNTDQLMQPTDFGFEQQRATSDKCAQLFLVDPTTCQISVRADLKRHSLSECQLVIRARDLPLSQTNSASDETQITSKQQQQSLSSTSVLTVFIDHLAEISAHSQIGFADTSYTVELAENVPINTLVKLLPILNKPEMAFPLTCELISGNELGKFIVIENEQRDCELRTRDPTIDYETRQRFNLIVRLNTIGSQQASVFSASSSSSNSQARRSNLVQIQVNILDKNDNRPTFSAPPRYGQLTQGKFLAAIASEAPSETQVIQVRAIDLDSAQANGMISYALLNEQELEGRFKVDSIDGIIRTSRPVEDLPSTRLPIRLKVVARDTPEQASEALEAMAEIVLNLIDDQHRVALVLKDTPVWRVLDNRDELLRILQERTGLIAGLERVESLKVQRNSTPIIEADVSGTDVWFYLIEPGSLRIVPTDDPRLKAALFESRAQSSLADILGQTLTFPHARLRQPYALMYGGQGGGAFSPNGRTSTSSNFNGGSLAAANLLFGTFRADSSDRLAPILILVALFIAFASAIVVVYQCGSAAGWNESTAATAGGPANSAAHLQGFGKEKFLFSQPPPPASFHHNQNESQNNNNNNNRLPQELQFAFGGGGGGGGGLSPGAGTLQSQQQQQLDQETLYQLGAAAAQAKEYETQMLKMSVLFDDNQSFDERNLHEQTLATRNLV